ncbi:MAG: DUF805 domain-containing protein [Sodaliphilus sp.]|nr:DUF805 domain-containing protein [Sodaliphilus sp.]
MEENINNNATAAGGNVVSEMPRLTFGEAVKTCLKKYADFTGRARRSEYWFFYLFYFLVVVVASFVFEILGLLGMPKIIGTVGNLVVTLGFILPQYAVEFRRLHDTGRSGWWIGGYLLFGLVVAAQVVFMALDYVQYGGMGMMYEFVTENVGAFVGLLLMGGIAVVWNIALIVFCVLDSKPEANKYGASPKYK